MQDKQLPSSVIRVGNNLYRWQQPGPVSIGSQAADAAALADDGSTAEQPLASSVQLADLRKSPTGTPPAVTVGVPASPLRSLASLVWLRDRGAAEVCMPVPSCITHRSAGADASADSYAEHLALILACCPFRVLLLDKESPTGRQVEADLAPCAYACLHLCVSALL